MTQRRQPGVIDPTLVGASDGRRRRPRDATTDGEAGDDGARPPGPVPGPVPAPVAPTATSPRGGMSGRRAAPTPPPTLSEAEAEAAEATASAPEQPARWGRVAGAFVLLAGAFLVYDSARVLIDIWRSTWIGGAALTGLALLFVVLLARAIVTETRALRRLGEVERVRAALERALADDRPARLTRSLNPILALIDARRPALVKAFRQRSRGLDEPDAVLKQFRGAVLQPLDQEARRVVRANALAIMGATAVSPHPALDVVIVLWRSTVMVRRVAEVYGLRPSTLSTVALTRRVVVSAAIAVAADPAGDVLATTFGGGLAEKVSARFAEGSISGLRALRLGGRAIEICRPLPFEPDERKGLWQTLTQG